MRINVEQCSGRQWSRMAGEIADPTLDQYEASRYVHPLFAEGPPARPSRWRRETPNRDRADPDQHYKALPTTTQASWPSRFTTALSGTVSRCISKGSRTRVV